MKILVTTLLLVMLSPLGAAQKLPQSGLPEGAKLRLGNGKITRMQYSPDGARLAVATGIGIWIYDTAKRSEPALFAAHEGVVWCLDFSPDGSVLASGGWDNNIRLWNASTGDLLRTLEGHTSRIIDVAFNRDGATLASVDDVNAVHFWDTVSGELRRSFVARTEEGMAPRGVGAVFGADSSTLAVWSFANTDIDLWDASTGKHLRTFKGHTENVSSVAFSSDGSMLASGSWRESTRLWDVGSGEFLRQLDDTETGVTCVGFSPDGVTLACGDRFGSTRIWHTETGEPLRTLGGHTYSLAAFNFNSVIAIAFSPDGGRLATADTSVRVWNSKTAERLWGVEGHFDHVDFVAISPDGATLASEGSRQPIRVWDTVTGAYKRSIGTDTSLSPNFVFRPDWSDPGERRRLPQHQTLGCLDRQGTAQLGERCRR